MSARCPRPFRCGGLCDRFQAADSRLGSGNSALSSTRMPAPDLDAWLAAHGVGAFAGTVRGLGVVLASDMRFVTAAEMEGIGMGRIACARVRDAALTQFPEPLGDAAGARSEKGSEAVGEKSGAPVAPVSPRKRGRPRTAPPPQKRPRRPPPVLPSCKRDCAAFIAGLEPHLVSARRPAGSDRRSEYQHGRLKDVIVRLCFDAEGKYRAHEVCLRAFLGVSTRWMADARRAAVEVRLEPTLELGVGDVRAMGGAERKRVLERLVRCREEDVGLTAEEVLAGLPEDGKVVVAKRIIAETHALVGRRSNFAQVAAREVFREMVRDNRAPAVGPGGDGPLFYLDKRWDAVRLKSEGINDEKFVPNERKASFYRSLREVLKERAIAVPSGRTVAGWFREDFGPTVEGEYTTAFKAAKKSAGEGEASSSPADSFIDHLGVN